MNSVLSTSNALDWQAFALSVKLALCTVAVLLPMGLLGGWWLARTRSVFKPLVEGLLLLPLVLPPTVLGFYLLVGLGASSPLGSWLQEVAGLQLVFSFSGLVVASVLFNVPFMLQPIQRAFEAIPLEFRESAAVCGLSRWAMLRRIELPLAWPGILSGVVLSFVHTLGEFGVVLMTGGNIPGQTRTAAISIYDSVQNMNYAQAHAMAVVLVAFSVVAVWVVFGVLGKRTPRAQVVL